MHRNTEDQKGDAKGMLNTMVLRTKKKVEHKAIHRNAMIDLNHMHGWREMRFHPKSASSWIWRLFNRTLISIKHDFDADAYLLNI